MRRVKGGIFEAGVDIRLFQVRKISKTFLRLHPAGKHFQHLARRNPHPANRRLAAADKPYPPGFIGPDRAMSQQFSSFSSRRTVSSVSLSVLPAYSLA